MSGYVVYSGAYLSSCFLYAGTRLALNARLLCPNFYCGGREVDKITHLIFFDSMKRAYREARVALADVDDATISGVMESVVSRICAERHAKGASVKLINADGGEIIIREKDKKKRDRISKWIMTVEKSLREEMVLSTLKRLIKDGESNINDAYVEASGDVLETAQFLARTGADPRRDRESRAFDFYFDGGRSREGSHICMVFNASDDISPNTARRGDSFCCTCSHRGGVFCRMASPDDADLQKESP